MRIFGFLKKIFVYLIFAGMVSVVIGFISFGVFPIPDNAQVLVALSSVCFIKLTETTSGDVVVDFFGYSIQWRFTLRYPN